MRKNKEYTIKKKTLEKFVLFTLFVLSFFNSGTLLLFFLSLLFLLLQKEVGALKIINLATLRTIINPGIAINIGRYSTLKMTLIMGCAILLISSYFKMTSIKKRKLKWPVFTIIFFTVYNVIIAFYSSSLPVIASFKVVSYSVVFIGILIGVCYTIDRFDIFGWLLGWLKMLIFASLVTIPFPVSYLVNGRAFQGLINHPNMFGIVSVLFIAMLLGSEKKKYDSLFLIAALLMIVLSDSRTSLISAIVILFMFLFDKGVFKMSYWKLEILYFGTFFSIVFHRKIAEFFTDFLAKGQTLDNMLYSREDQVNNLLVQFKQKPLFGNGFGVPVLPFKSYSFSMDFIVEPGNLFLAVLSYSGIIGFLLFTVYMLQIFFSNRGNMTRRTYLFIAPLIISMGEMVFFSSNNIGPVCYMSLAMYMFYDKDVKAGATIGEDVTSFINEEIGQERVRTIDREKSIVNH